jgi:F-type H+-transporting ATPase subunit delta
MAEIDIRYASAILEISEEAGTLDKTLEEAVFLHGALSDGEGMRIITHPHISAADTSSFITEMFSGKVQDHLLGCMHLMVEKNRAAYITTALAELISMIRKRKGLTEACVVSATEMSEAQLSKLKSVLTAKLGKQVEITQSVDKSIIGGFYIQAGGYLIDRTVKKQLHEMKVHIEKRGAAHDSQA